MQRVAALTTKVRVAQYVKGARNVLKFFDSLVHVTRDGSWLGARRYDAGLDRLLAEMKLVDPYRACLVAIADHADNETVLQCTQRHPGHFVPIGSINPCAMASSRQVAAAVAELAQQGFAGLKLHPRLNHYDPLDPLALAAIDAAGQHGLVLFLCTLFRQRGRPVTGTADIIDQIANRCRSTKIVLLHGGASSMLDLFELVRMHENLVLDLSFTLLRYAGSSLDLDMKFVCRELDQRLIVGSDFPEYTPRQAFDRIIELTADLPSEKRDNILWRNLTNLFAHWRRPSAAEEARTDTQSAR